MKYGLGFLVFLTLPAIAQTFLPGTEDIPCMTELFNVEETASFDNPEERMVLINAQTKTTPHNILSFYKEALTNLGWTQKKPGHFKRGNDVFIIEITPSGKVQQIQFQLSQTNL